MDGIPTRDIAKHARVQRIQEFRDLALGTKYNISRNKKCLSYGFTDHLFPIVLWTIPTWMWPYPPCGSKSSIYKDMICLFVTECDGETNIFAKKEFFSVSRCSEICPMVLSRAPATTNRLEIKIARHICFLGIRRVSVRNIIEISQKLAWNTRN